MVIGEMLRWALTKLIMRAAGGQAKKACGNLQLCAGLEAGIQGATHAVGQKRIERKIQIRSNEEARRPGEEEEEDEEEEAERLTVEKKGTYEEMAEILVAALDMEVEEKGEGYEGGDGTQRALESIEFLTQESEPSGTTIVDACNGFNKLSRLAMLWTVRHHWPVGTSYAFD